MTDLSDYYGEATSLSFSGIFEAAVDLLYRMESDHRKFRKIHMSAGTLKILNNFLHDDPFARPTDDKRLRIVGLDIVVVDDFHDGLLSLTDEERCSTTS